MKSIKTVNSKGKSQKAKSRAKKIKIKCLLTGIFLLILIFHSQGISSDKEDLKVIKKMVKAEDFLISSKSLEEAKWLKICVADKNRRDKENVEIKIYLPFLETILKSSKNCRIRNEKTKIDLREIIEDLKRIGSMELFLLEDEESIVKIWLE